MQEQQFAKGQPNSVMRDAVVLSLAYFVLAGLAIHLAARSDAVANVWFANAAAMAVLSSTGRSRWTPLLLCMAAANLAANMVYRDGVLLSLSFLPGNVVEVVAGAWLLQRNDLWCRFDKNATAFVSVLISGAVLPNLLGATLGASMLQWHGFATFESAWLDWYVGSVLGGVAVLPAALMSCQLAPAQVFRHLTSLKTLGLLFITVAFGLFVLHTLPHPIVYLTLPLIAAAFLLTPLSTLVLCFAMVTTVVAAIAYSIFALPVITSDWQRVVQFLPVIAVLIPAQLLAILVERKRVLVDRFRLVIEAAPSAMLMVDKRGLMSLVNAQAEALFGYARAELLDQPVAMLEPEQMRQGSPGSWSRCFDPQSLPVTTTGVDFFGVRKDGREVPIEIGLNPIQIEEDWFVLASIVDITERKQAAETLNTRNQDLQVATERARAADQLKSAFLATMSHELRTPLTSIIGFVGLINNEVSGPLNDTQSKQLDAVQRNAWHLLALINDVLDLSKIEAGQFSVRCEPFDLRNAIEKAAQTVEPLAQGKSLALRVDIFPEIGMLTNDQLRIEQVLLNLLSNAIKFTERGEVSLVVSASPEGVRMRVSDTGIGIRPQDMETLFQPFRQVDSGSERANAGTGLGLAICRRLAELMGGHVYLESEWGKGTVATFTLPMDAAVQS